MRSLSGAKPDCRRRHRRRAALRRGALLLVCCLVAIGCERAPEPAAPAEMVWAIGAIDAEERGPALEIARIWNDRNPGGPRVKVHALPAAADDQRQVMAIELNAGLSGFDVLTLDVVWTGEFAVNGWLAELQDLRSTLRKVTLAAPLESATWDDRLWAAPFTSDPAFLYYRTDLVLGDVPKAWGELMKAGLDVERRAGIAPFVGQGAQYEGLVVNYLEYLWGAGGDLFDEQGEVEFGKGPARQALDFMREARQRGFFGGDFETMKEEEARSAFQNGQAVFMRNWPYAYRELKGRGDSPSMVVDKFAIAPLPTFDGQGTTSAIGGSNLAVSRFSKNRQAAENFVVFASTDRDVQRLLAKDYARGPALASVYDDTDMRDDPVMALRGEVLKHARARPPTPEWNAISDEIQQNVFPAYTGTLDPGVAVREIRAFLELTAAQRR